MKRWLIISFVVVFCVFSVILLSILIRDNEGSIARNPYDLIPLLKRMELVPGSSDSLFFSEETPKGGKNFPLKPFYIDRFETTNLEFDKFLRKSGYQSPEEFAFFQFKRGARAALASQKAYHPVVHVTYFDALAYAKWKGKSLPTQSQWFWAAIGPSNYRYPWGNEEASEALCNTLEANFGETTVVGTFESGRSSFSKAYDMGGNVWEWTRTARGGRDLSPSEKNLPHAVIVLGGAFNTTKEAAVCLNREPEDRRCFKSPGAFDSAQGFRCVKEADEGIIKKLIEMTLDQNAQVRSFARSNLLKIGTMGIAFLVEAWLDGNQVAGELSETLLSRFGRDYFQSFEQFRGMGYRAEQLEENLSEWLERDAR